MPSAVSQQSLANPSAGGSRSTREVTLNRGYQFRALFPLLVSGAVLIILSMALVFLPLQSHIAADANPVFRSLLGAQLLRVELWLGPLVVLSGCLAAILALVHARRVAAPLGRLRLSLAKLAIGETEPVVFRRGEEFAELGPAFAAVASRMEELTKGKIDLLRFMRRNIEGLSQRAAQSIPPAELRESLEVLMRDIDAEIKKTQLKA